jgi:tetratricopeptide (TPR) repeat protein
MNSSRSIQMRPSIAALLRATLLCSLMLGSAATLQGCKSSSNQFKGDGSANLRKALDHASRGESLRKAGKFAPAAEEYKKSLAAKSDLGAVWVNYGACLVELGDFMPARDAFLRAADLLPADPTPYENLGTLYHLRGYDEKALEYYNLSLEKEANWLPSLRGSVMSAKNLRLGDDNALDRVNRAIIMEKDPKFLLMMQNERFRIEALLKDKAGK